MKKKMKKETILSITLTCNQYLFVEECLTISSLQVHECMDPRYGKLVELLFCCYILKV